MKTFNNRSAFSLVEIVITLAIISTVVVALIGILPAGMDSAREAANRTVLAAVLEDIHNRLEGNQLKEGMLEESPFFYDTQGVFIPDTATGEEKAERIYRADIEIVKVHSDHLPENTDGLMGVKIAVWWPVDGASGKAFQKEPQTSISYYLTTLTGRDWETIDPSYEAKIEF
jgi:uncharacterized protein (TIGR02598 family)